MSVARHSSALAMAGIVEYGTQLLLPVILVRHLSMADFGEYRLLWLAANTAAVLSFFMPQSLFFFLPRMEEDERAQLIGNTALFLLCVGTVAGLGFWLLAPQISDALSAMSSAHVAAPLFVGLWVMASLFDTVAVADGRADIQARAAISLSIFRFLALGFAAVLIDGLASVVIAMTALAAIKFTLALVYGAYWPHRQKYQLDLPLLRRQVLYATPFAFGNALFLLRAQTDQWIAASLFSAESFALVSTGAVVLSLASLVRQPICNALLPPLGKLLAADEGPKASRLIAQGNVAIAILLLPFLGWLFACAPDLISLVYTEAYQPAATLMRFYLMGLAASVIGGGYLLAAVGAGRSAVIISAVNLVLSASVSWIAARAFGLVGTVAGSVATMIIGEVWALSVVAKKVPCSVWALWRPSVVVRVYAVVLSACVVTNGINIWLADESVIMRVAIATAGFIGVVAALAVGLHLHHAVPRLLSRMRA